MSDGGAQAEMTVSPAASAVQRARRAMLQVSARAAASPAMNAQAGRR